MLTPLEEWQFDANSQKEAEAFIESPTGRKLLAALSAMNKPLGSNSVGQDRVFQDAALNQNSVGYQMCLDNIPRLLPAKIQDTVSQQQAREKVLNPHNYYKRSEP